MSGAELAAPYISKLKKPREEFHKAMWTLAIMDRLHDHLRITIIRGILQLT